MPRSFLGWNALPCADHRQMHDPVVIIVFPGTLEPELAIPALQLGLGAKLDLSIRGAQVHGTLREFPRQGRGRGPPLPSQRAQCAERSCRYP